LKQEKMTVDEKNKEINQLKQEITTLSRNIENEKDQNQQLLAKI
jgi:peptidoglycan hydrolase CwlO-like protein